MIVAVPAPTPVTTPDNEPTVATPVPLLLHVPPEDASNNVVDVPAHIVVKPVTAPGSGFTVIEYCAAQPVLDKV